MAAAAVRRRLTWERATVVTTERETRRAVRITLEVDGWAGHVAGQHVDVRLTASDGYTAQRSYSIASPPQGTAVQLVVDRLDDGEVSTYLTDELRPGDVLEVRGPVGGYFVWPGEIDRPVQLVAGGSGVVPFLAMIGYHREVASRVAVRLLYSARTLDDVIARADLDAPPAGVDVTLTLTRGAPAGWTGPTGRVDAGMLERFVVPPDREPEVLVCGPTPFVEAVARRLVRLGHATARIRTERFGTTGEAR